MRKVINDYSLYEKRNGPQYINKKDMLILFNMFEDAISNIENDPPQYSIKECEDFLRKMIRTARTKISNKFM